MNPDSAQQALDKVRDWLQSQPGVEGYGAAEGKVVVHTFGMDAQQQAAIRARLAPAKVEFVEGPIEAQ